MKRIALFLAAASLFLALPASANHSDHCGNDGRNGDGQVIRGTNHDDCLRGGNAPDTVMGRGGDDRLGGNHGADRIFGGRGDDRLHGGRGPDLLVGGPGFDLCAVDASDRVRGCERIKNPGRN